MPIIDEEGVRITLLHRADHGELEARLSVGGETYPVTRRYGSWMVLDGDKLRELKHPYTHLLAKKARVYEKGEQKNAN